MALEHRTAIGGIQIDRKGTGSVLLKLLVADGNDEFSEQNHRFTVQKGEDVAAAIADVNAHLAMEGRMPIGNKAARVITETLEACWAAMDS